MKKPVKLDSSKIPFHMRVDNNIRNENIDAGKPLCEHCDGTGNELLSMYRSCPICKGTGVAPKTNEGSSDVDM